MPHTRPPAVADRFYPGDPQQLRILVRQCLGPEQDRSDAIGAVVPHAGLQYSGECAGAVFSRISLPELIVILAPNHTGFSDPAGRASIWPDGEFGTALGPVVVDAEFAARLEHRCDGATFECSAHRDEHGIEVELPFLRVVAPASRVVPIVMPFEGWQACAVLATALAETAREYPEPVLFLASSDMTHYEPVSRAAARDRMALDEIRAVDGERLLAVCREHHISMCGRAPTAVMLEAARQVGATRGEIVDYRHSGMVTGDEESVVAYAGAVIT